MTVRTRYEGGFCIDGTYFNLRSNQLCLVETVFPDGSLGLTVVPV